MAFFPRPAHPRVVLADIKRLWATSTRRYKLVFGTAAVAVTSLLVTMFVVESRWGVMPEGPQIVYASDWPSGRTDAQIKDQQRADAMENRKLADERRRQWQKLDKSLDGLGL